jgi:hypothetical protein
MGVLFGRRMKKDERSKSKDVKVDAGNAGAVNLIERRLAGIELTLITGATSELKLRKKWIFFYGRQAKIEHMLRRLSSLLHR